MENSDAGVRKEETDPEVRFGVRENEIDALALSLISFLSTMPCNVRVALSPKRSQGAFIEDCVFRVSR